MFVLPTSKTKR